MKPKIFLLSCLSFIIFNFSFIIGTVRYVSKTGSSTPPYTTWETAADSIMECINISVFGDTIYIANGVYKERIDMIPGLSLIGAGMDSCVIDTRELAPPYYTIQTEDGCYLSNLGIICHDVDDGAGIDLLNSKIEFCKIQEAKVGFYTRATSQNSAYAYKNILLNVYYGILCFGTPLISENLLVPNSDGLSSEINSSPTYINNIVSCGNCVLGFYDALGFISKLKDNLFYGNGDYAFVSYGNDSIVNNVIYGDNGIWEKGITGADSKAMNNHIQNTNTALYYDQPGGSPQTFRYNNLWNNQNNSYNVTIDSTNTFNIPMFVNEDSLDFHLQKYSPLIDAGDPNLFDKDGTRSDIGLYGGPFGEDYHYYDYAPRIPMNVTGNILNYIVLMKWNKNEEVDFSHYNIYRDTTENFKIDSTLLILSTSDTNFTETIPNYVEKIYYKVTAVDNQDNESEPSEEVGFILTGTNDQIQIINDYRLYQNYPNPFNPSTKISYRLKERGYVKLYVYDIKGELISVLVNKTQEAGFYEADFNVKRETSDVKRDLASGIYIYQIMVKNENNIPVFTDMKKMIYLK